MKTQQQEAGRGNGSKKAKKRLDKIDSALRLNKDRREPLLQLSKVLHQITPLLSLPQKLSQIVSEVLLSDDNKSFVLTTRREAVEDGHCVQQ